MSTNMAASKASNIRNTIHVPLSSDLQMQTCRPPKRNSEEDIPATDRPQRIEGLNGSSLVAMPNPISVRDSLVTSVGTPPKEFDVLHSDLIQRMKTMSLETQEENNSMTRHLQANSARTFTCFPNLPLELRRLIWIAAAAIPQVIPMKTTYKHFAEDNDAICIHAAPLAYHSHLLRVSIEAREEAQKVYLPSRISAHPKSIILANAVNDILWFEGISSTDLASYMCGMATNFLETENTLPVLTPIHKLAVPWFEWSDHALGTGGSGEWMMRFMASMAAIGLREISLVTENTAESTSPNVIFTKPTRAPLESGLLKLLNHFGLAPDDSWDQLEEKFNTFLVGVQLQRVIERQSLLDKGT
jgi:hypothetical protein